MKKSMTQFAFWILTFVAISVSYREAETYCVIFPQNGRDIFSVTQRSFLVMRDNEVDLIPAVQFEGDARDFGILVPVPNVPRISTAGSQLFSEASFLTQPVLHQTNESCNGCDRDDRIFLEGDLLASGIPTREGYDALSDGVNVIYERQVGAFLAVVLEASNASALTGWLNENDYRYEPADSTVLDEYVQRDWVFVAMKLDTSQAPPHIDRWWTAFTAPAKITFTRESEALTYPLKISAISTRSRSEVLIYTVGPKPMRFEGAEVEYANLIGEKEERAIAERFPTLSEFVFEGVFVTKLRRDFTKEEMQQELTIFETDDFTEYREIRFASNSLRGGMFLAALLGVVLLHRDRRAGRKGVKA